MHSSNNNMFTVQILCPPSTKKVSFEDSNNWKFECKCDYDCECDKNIKEAFEQSKIYDDSNSYIDYFSTEPVLGKNKNTIYLGARYYGSGTYIGYMGHVKTNTIEIQPKTLRILDNNGVEICSEIFTQEIMKSKVSSADIFKPTDKEWFKNHNIDLKFREIYRLPDCPLEISGVEIKPNCNDGETVEQWLDKCLQPQSS